MPPKKKTCAPALSVRQDDDSDDIHDESSDSEIDDDPVSRQIGRDAARDTLGPRSREHYARFQNAMVSWARKQNLSLSAEKRYKVHVPFSYRFVATYLDFLKQKKIPWPHNPSMTKQYSTGSILAVISAIKDAYRIEETPIQDEIETLMSNFYKAYCKFIGREKMLGRYPLKVGRSAISISSFKLISQKLFQMHCGRSWNAQICMWPYWNLIGTVLSRAERVGHALVDHLSMKEDMILLDLSTSKTDPTGILSYAKCIASNPFEPFSDVFLGLAILFFCRHANSDNRLFSYADMPATATIYLKQVLDSLTPVEEMDLGCSKDLVGLHTAKKTGCSKLYDNECTVSVAIEKRCDHNLHGSQGAYIGDLPGNDAFNARILAGLPFGKDEFAAKPCHFDGMPQNLWADIPWKSLIKGYEKFPASSKSAMPLFLAAIIHHEQFIRHRLSGGGGHPILFSPLFTIHKRLFDLLRPYIKLGLCESEMTTTGVPLASKTHATVHRIDMRLANIETAMQRLNLLPPSMPQDALSSCSHESQIESKLDKVLEVLTTMTSSSAGGQYLHLKAPAPVWEIGYLPNTFRIASLSVEQLWRAWHVATSSGPALQAICGKMLPAGENRNNDIRQLSRYSKVVQCIRGPSKVVAENVEEYFAALWKQCEDLAQDSGILLGSAHQGAGTFYNCICSNKALKEALLSPSRSNVVIVAQSSSLIAVPVNARNGVYFTACRERASALHALPQQELSIASRSSISMQLPIASRSSISMQLPIASRSSTSMQLSRETNQSQSQIAPSAAVCRYPTPEVFDPSLLTNFQLASFSVEQLWRAWHVATPSSPALKHICGKMITGKNRINDIRQLSRYTRVVDFITGTSKIPYRVSSENVEQYFSDLWDQCNDIANEHGMILGSTHQSAGTFYGNVIANNVVKKAFLSPTRAVSIVAACQ
jgi:hypothetical protein